jgi:short-subunit dehydrogenase
VNVVLLARRKDALEKAAASIRQTHAVEARAVPCDLSSGAFVEALKKATDDLEIGLGIYNAGYSFIGNTLDQPLERALKVVEVNCMGPLRLAHALVPKMIERKRGGLVLMSSIAGYQGGPRLAPYAASKAFNRILAEGLWAELAGSGVDVLASCPGAIRTPNYLKTTDKEAPGTMDPIAVAEDTLNALGSGPTRIIGVVNRMASAFLGMLPRANAISIMKSGTANLRDG